MSDNWIVQNLLNALRIWNEKLAEIWSLLTTTPQQFKNGAIWRVMVSINDAVKAIGLALLVIFFLSGVIKTSGSFAEVKKPEHALKLFIRFAIAKGIITYGMDLMLAAFEIIQGVITTIMNSTGTSIVTETVLPEEMITAIEDCGFFDSIPLKELREYRTDLMTYIRSYGQDIISEIDENKVLTDDLADRIEKILTAFEE